MSAAPITLPDVELAKLLRMEQLVEALRKSFTEGCSAPAREHHPIEGAQGEQGMLLLMPAWSPAGPTRYLGVKQVNIFPQNAALNRPALTSIYNLFDGNTGEHLASMDGNTITGRRTVAVSALAARYLSRRDSKELLVLGSGRVASLIPYAYRAVRDIESVKIWDINRAGAERLQSSLAADGFECEIADSLEHAVRSADIVSAATLSTTPLILGEWLRPGTHVDLIGAFTPGMRESDNHCVAMSDVYTDTGEAMHEAGDLIQPKKTGAIGEDHVKGTLSDLVTGRALGRESDASCTLFKAVGTALADLSAATLAYEAARRISN
ncbi:ornithine cyclodeaminase family protein [Sinorhizobium medicae]|nr:ornithine cyclodeaminase family protein [Sinorhizobium medicae]MDX0444517.1 ornithine cyclodeaminase family protein [Sinorhizobium medicae]MDX0489793.1 ornithine cyclodeaminase family protein [Sinorhizobium medicae]MDX0523619.1 ornithine cyclodeaminase family protein [Sinorhizobium medicae]MDX0539578.1 ornithine cyclodeaminase family protein [Sinorhizobium medicae]